MPQTHVLEERDSLRTPFIGSVLLHSAVFGLLVLSTMQFQHARETWGGETHSGTAVPVNAVKNIPLPQRTGPLNPVANDTESQIPQAPKPELKKKVKAPEEKAIPIRSPMAKPQPKPQAPRYHPEPLRPNQVPSEVGAAAVSPIFQKPGSGNIGVGPNNVLGNRFGAYADLVIRRVSDKWITAGLAGLQTAPLVIVTFDILRDGSVRNVQIVQRSGNTSLDYSVQRAVTDAAPFPPLPTLYERNEANVELRFQLQR